MGVKASQEQLGTALRNLFKCPNDISQKFFRDITQTSSCLHHLLPAAREQSLISRFRTYEKFPRVYTRTRRYCSFVNHALNNYQDKITNP